MTDRSPQAREPAITAPWPALAIVAAMIAAYAVQSLSGFDEGLVLRFGFAPADLDEGRLITLITYQFLHGGWTHVGMNAAWALAFAPPVARYLGARDHASGVRPAAKLFLFYLTCGALAAIGYALMHLHQPSPPLVGASGAVAGLMGAGSRLLVRGGGLAALGERRVISMGLAWGVINVVLGLAGYAPGLGRVTIAWEAHIAGYLAGLLLIGPAARVLMQAEP